jgi:predicted ABC-type exoprotein transport system permease subunit
MTELTPIKKDEKILSFEERLEKNEIIAVVIVIVLVLAGVPITLSVILSILITVCIVHVRGKR